MFYLWLAIGCSTLIALILKFAENRNTHRFAVLSANYTMATTVSLTLWLLAPKPEQAFNFTQGWQDLMALFAGTAAEATFSSSVIWACMVGLFTGCFFFASFYFYQKAVREHGVALAGAFSKLGFLVPTFMSIALWAEYPAPVQWIGISLAILAFFIVNWPGKQSLSEALHPLLFLLCMMGGMGEFSKKIFQQYGLQDQKALFLLVTFGMALMLSLIAILRKKQPLHFKDLTIGFVLGVPNIFCSYFLVKALGLLPAAVAFPLFGAGSIALVFIGGLVLFGERLKRKEIFAISLIILAMAFN